MAFLMYYPRMTAIQTCGYVKGGSNVYDMCGNAAAMQTGVQMQVAGATSATPVSLKYSDNTTATKCFGGSAACASNMINDYASCVPLVRDVFFSIAKVSVIAY